jgi:hypothetical protein
MFIMAITPPNDSDVVSIETEELTNPSSDSTVAPAEKKVQGNTDAPKVYPPDMERLASALSFLDPDADDFFWKFRVMAPLANTAKSFPEFADVLRKLAIAFSRGDFQDTPSVKWVTPGSNGKSGKQVFNSVWARFYNGTFSGTPTSLGTLYFEAKAAGWIPPEEQMAAEMEDPE